MHESGSKELISDSRTLTVKRAAWYLLQMAFTPAERSQSKLRAALNGPAGAGKTFTMLQILWLLGGGKKRAVMDSERGSASKYAKKRGVAAESMGAWAFDSKSLEEKSPQEYIAEIGNAAGAGYELLGIDSLSHAWLGALDMIDRGGGWMRAGKTVSPLVAKVIDAMLSYPGHVVATLRSKSEHVIEKDEKTGRTNMRKVGMASVARDGTEFEFDIIFDLALDGVVTVTKSRAYEALPVNTTFRREDWPKVVEKIRGWLDEGAPVGPLDSLIERVRFSQTLPQLLALVPELSALPLEDRRILKPIYDARKAALIDDTAGEL